MIDGAVTRREVLAVHVTFGNKVAILGGDYLLARASIFLARLRDVEMVYIMSGVIEHLVRGEVIQMRGVRGAAASGSGGDYYSLATEGAGNVRIWTMEGNEDLDEVDNDEDDDNPHHSRRHH